MRHGRQWHNRVLSGRMIGRSGDTVYDPHHTHGGDEKHEFSILASKPTTMVWWFDLSKLLLRFGDLGLKITTMISWFRPQNQGEEIYRFAPQNWWADEDGVRTRVSLLRCEASHARVSRFGPQNQWRWWPLVHVAPSHGMRRINRKFGWLDGALAVQQKVK
jgi:hypothetical protein